MRRTFVVTLVLTAILIAMAVPMIGDVLAQRGGNAAAAYAGTGTGEADDADGDADGDAEAVQRSREGPPPWAHSGAKAEIGKGLGAWQRLTPAARDRLMSTLVKEHRAGMKAFKACRTAGRADCTKPLPPGLAKRQ